MPVIAETAECAWWPEHQLFDALTEWAPYRYAPRAHRPDDEWVARARICHACGATTHQPARRGWSWRMARARGKSGRFTQSRCERCAANGTTA